MVAFNNTLSDCVQNSKDSLSNSYEYENVVTFKSRFDRKLFPEDFDVWTVHKQYTWINKNLIKFFPNVPQSLLNYIPAAFKQPDFDRSPVEIPEWLDMEKYSRGQKFVRENWASIMLSSLMGIICSYSFDDVLKPLIITRQSDTPYLGFIRYNFCRGSFEEIKQRTQNFYQCWIIPNLRDITPEWEHMTRCIIESMNYYSLMCMSCKTIILLTTDILNLSMSHLHGSLSYLEWIAYKSWTFIMHYAMRFSSLRILFNKMMQNMFEEAANFTPEKHEELQKRSEKQLSNFSIVD
ncbi:hypothetical protein DMN91_001096 [Ooceraea biroi]|uniref:Uncharacterized protein n=1 Tax=Ooceraea biroi TaxID=2015173 RepID=A0A3L8E4E9_OOCBI|nr:hypothetical protein DMN91_001096 [Ooceraea biroi]